MLSPRALAVSQPVMTSSPAAAGGAHDAPRERFDDFLRRSSSAAHLSAIARPVGAGGADRSSSAAAKGDKDVPWDLLAVAADEVPNNSPESERAVSGLGDAPKAPFAQVGASVQEAASLGRRQSGLAASALVELENTSLFPCDSELEFDSEGAERSRQPVSSRRARIKAARKERSIAARSHRDSDLLFTAQRHHLGGLQDSMGTITQLHEQLVRWLRKARMFRQMSGLTLKLPQEHGYGMQDGAAACSKYHRCLALIRLIELRMDDLKSEGNAALSALYSRNVLREVKVIIQSETAEVISSVLGQPLKAVGYLVDALSTSDAAAIASGAVALLVTILDEMCEYQPLSTDQAEEVVQSRLLELGIFPAIEDKLLEIVKHLVDLHDHYSSGSCVPLALVEWLAQRCDAELLATSLSSAAQISSPEEPLDKKEDMPPSRHSVFLELLATFLKNSDASVCKIAAKHMRSFGDYDLEIQQLDAAFAEHTAADGPAASPQKTINLRVFSDRLSTASPYFRALFSNSMREKKDKKVLLQVDNPAACVACIEHCYTGQFPNFDDETAVEFITLAHKFQLKLLKARAEQYVLNRWRSSDVSASCTVDEIADLIDIAAATECSSLQLQAETSMFELFFIPAIDAGDGVTAEYICENFPSIAGRLSASEISIKLYDAIGGTNKSESSALFLIDLMEMASAASGQDYVGTVIDDISVNSSRRDDDPNGVCGECFVNAGHLTSCSRFRREGDYRSKTSAATPWSRNIWANPAPPPPPGNGPPAPPPPPGSGTPASPFTFGAQQTNSTHTVSASRAHLVGLAISNAPAMVRVARRLVEVDATLVNQGAPTISPLALAVRLENDQLVKFFALHGGLDPFDAVHSTALSDAVALDRYDYVKILLEARLGGCICPALDDEYAPYCDQVLLGLEQPAADCSNLFSPLQSQSLPVSALTLAIIHRKPNEDIIRALASDPWASSWLNDSLQQACTPLIAASAMGRLDLCELLLNPSLDDGLTKQSKRTESDDDDVDSGVGFDRTSTYGPLGAQYDDGKEADTSAQLVGSALVTDSSVDSRLFAGEPKVTRCNPWAYFNLWWHSRQVSEFYRPVPQIMTPLHIAAWCGHGDVVSFFLQLHRKESKREVASDEGRDVDYFDAIPSSALASAQGATAKVFEKFGYVEPGEPLFHVSANWIGGLPPPPGLVVPELRNGGVASEPMPQVDFSGTVFQAPPSAKQDDKAHTLVKYKARGLHSCSICGGRLLGLFHVGFRCVHCRKVAHTKCRPIFEWEKCDSGDFVKIVRLN